MEKVCFRLQRDAEGYPPADVESVWANRLSDGFYSLDNIPFFSREATLGDIVKTVDVDGEKFFSAIHKRSGNSLVRVVVYDNHETEVIRRQLSDLGCSSELSHLESLFAINVPPNVSIESVRALLNSGFDEGWLDYEEPILRQ
jgi:hypothetical protein